LKKVNGDSESEKSADQGEALLKLKQVALQKRFDSCWFSCLTVWAAGMANKRSHDLYDLTIDPTASQVIKEIFYLYYIEQEDMHRIASWLHFVGRRTKQG